MRQNSHYLFYMSCLDTFGVLAGVGINVLKICGVRSGAGVLKPDAGAESESEKCDSAHHWCFSVTVTSFDPAGF